MAIQPGHYPARCCYRIGYIVKLQIDKDPAPEFVDFAYYGGTSAVKKLHSYLESTDKRCQLAYKTQSFGFTIHIQG
jgi:hypothetical protein